MRHTTKMLLIPEDVYKALLEAGNTAKVSLLNNKTSMVLGNNDASSTAADQMLTKSRQKLVKLKRARHIDPDARHINYTQEFKRYKKYADDVANKPVNVHVSNMDQLTDTVMKDGKEKMRAKKAAIENRYNLEMSQMLPLPNLNANISVSDAAANEGEETIAPESVISMNKNKASINKKSKKLSPNRITLRNTIKPRAAYSPYQKLDINGAQKRIARNRAPITKKRITLKSGKTSTVNKILPRPLTSFRATLWNNNSNDSKNINND